MFHHASRAALALCLATAPTISAASDHPIVLSIDMPGGPVLSDDAKVKGGKVKDKDPNLPDMPIMLEDGWALNFRLTAPEAVGIVEFRESLGGGGLNMDVLVLDDPDGCLDLRGSIPVEYFGGIGAGITNSFETGCPGADETFINYIIDNYDDAGVDDIGSLCVGFTIPPSLIDDPAGTPPAMSNKAYVDNTPQESSSGLSGVGARTDGVSGIEDCFGYGISDDLPSLVVIAEVAGARVFDPVTRVYDNSIVRNLAGFVSGVSLELADNSGASALNARLPVTDGLLIPSTFADLSWVIGNFDFSTTPPMLPPVVTITTQIEDQAPVTTLVEGATETTELSDALFNQLPNDVVIEIRAVVVEGVAPAFIEESDGVPGITAGDLEAAGYTLLSNEAVKEVRMLSFPAVAEEQDGYECPSFRTVRYVDLNEDGEFGGCSDGDGTSQSGVRRPR